MRFLTFKQIFGHIFIPLNFSIILSFITFQGNSFYINRICLIERNRMVLILYESEVLIKGYKFRLSIHGQKWYCILFFIDIF